MGGEVSFVVNLKEELATDYTDHTDKKKKKSVTGMRKKYALLIVLNFVHCRVVRIGFDGSKSSYTDLPGNLF